MPKISAITKEQNNNIHPKWEDDDYIERLKVDNHDSYTQLTEGLKELCKGMDMEELDKKVSELNRAHDHVSNSLEAQRMLRKDNKVSDVMKKTAYTKGLLADQIGIAKSHKEKLLKQKNITPLEDE